ncbi:hypothetical protein B0H11DRAFT_2391504 [Mycena galericulata]|nr:hypothetical protein B0H11DRAFT_2391504 [Mycena galericulata]
MTTVPATPLSHSLLLLTTMSTRLAMPTRRVTVEEMPEPRQLNAAPCLQYGDVLIDTDNPVTSQVVTMAYTVPTPSFLPEEEEEEMMLPSRPFLRQEEEDKLISYIMRKKRNQTSCLSTTGPYIELLVLTIIYPFVVRLLC